MTDYLALFRALTAKDSNWAASANSANRPSSGPIGTIGTIAAGKKTPLPSDMADHDGYEERAALVTWEAGVPIEWAEGFATLQTALPPRSMTESRWRQIIDDAGRFLDRWAANAAALGWTTLDVFGVHPGAPEASHDGKGLAPLIARW